MKNKPEGGGMSKLFDCEHCGKRLKCELTSRRETLLKKYKRSRYFAEVKSIVGDDTKSDLEKGWLIGKIYDRGVRSYWQERYLDELIEEVFICLGSQGW